LFEARLSNELAELVRRLGGRPVAAPAVREVPHGTETADFVGALAGRRFSAVIALTGAAASCVLREAERQGRLADVLDSLRAATIVCRGPKPTAVMTRHSVHVDVIPEKPYTTRELLAAIEPLELAGRDVALMHYGERNAELSNALKSRGARLMEVCPYEWALPEDPSSLRALVANIAGQVDAVAFTSQIQVRNMFAVATEMGNAELVRDALNHDIVVAAVGPVCASALKQAGVTPDVQPGDPKMGPLLLALADYLELMEDTDKEQP
jgi:uroporphyrinogen-III synthase